MLGLGLGLGLSRVGRSIVAIIRDGLKAFYRFRDTTPDFLLEGSTSFDGSDDYIDIGSDSSLNFGTGDFSLSLWVKGTDTDGVLYSSYDGSAPHVYFRTHDSKLKFYMDSGGGDEVWSSTTLGVIDGQWHHIAVSVDRDVGVSMYIDGSLENLSATGTIGSVGDLGSSEDFNIGRHPSDATYWNGSIANVGIWNRALSASEIESIMWRGSYSELQDTELTNLVSWYDLDSISVGSSLVTNGTFSSDTTGWSGGNASLASVSGGQSGNCIEITMSSAGASLAYQWVAGLTSGKSYQFNAYVKSGTSGNDACKIELRASDGAEVLGTTSTTSTDTWTKISVIGSPKSGQVGVYLYLIRTTTDAGTILFDTVSGDKVQVLDSKGSNDGDVYGATVNTDSYSGTSPFKPRIKDKAQPKMAVQLADGSTSFDGDDYIDCGDDTSLDITSAITLSCWIKPNVLDETVNLIGRDDGTNRNFFLFLHSGDSKAYWYIFISGSQKETISTTNLVVGEWAHICGTYDGSNQKLYINGTLEDDDAETGSLDNDDVSFTIGAREAGADRHFDGSIANVSIHSSALTQAQVQELMFTEKYAGLSSGLKTNLVSWYDLGDTSLGSEMVTNGDVETGDLTGWGVVNSGTSVVQSANSTSPISGTYDSKTVITGNDSSHPRIHVTMSALTAGKTYRVSYKAKASEATTPNYVSLRVGLASTELALTRNEVTTSTQTFTQDVVATGAHTRFIWYASSDDGKTIYLDDVSVKEVLATDSQGSNEGSIYGATTNTGYTSSPHGVVDPLNLGSVYSGTAVHFDGANDYVNVPITLANGTYSVSLWAYQDAQDGEYLFDFRTGELTGYAYLSSATPAVVTPNNGTVYVNGEQSTTVNHVTWNHICITGITLEATSLQIGAHNAGAFYLDGRENNFQVFDTTLTQAQVQELYTNPEKILPTGVASSNLKLHLPMQEGVGSYVYDGSGNQNHGTLTGATWDSTKYSEGYQNALVRSNVPMIFDGTNDYVSLGTTYSYTNNTFSAWIKPEANSSADRRIIDTTDGNDDGLLLYVRGDNDKIQYSVNGSGLQSASTYNGQWVHVVGTYDGSTQKLYINGSLDQSTSTSQTISTTTNAIIGARSYTSQTSPFKGLINEVAIWDVALDADAITALYNSGTPLDATADSGNYASTDGLQGYWRNDNVTTWTDRANTGVATFDGSNDKLTVSHHSSLAPSAISMCGWFKPTTFATNAGIFNKDAAGANDGDWNIRSHSTGSGKLEHYVQDGSNTVIIVSDSAITLGAWSHFVITYDGTMKMYINGTLQSDTDTSTCDITNNGNSAQMGCHLTGSFFDGQLAGYHIFNVALSASEVTELYALDKRASISGHSKFSNCVGSWLMGAGTGDTTSTIQDQTSSNNDATVTSATLVGYNDGTVAGTPADILLPEGTTAGRDTQGFLLTDTTSISNGIRFDGSGQYIKIDDADLFQFGERDFTIELWAKFYEITSTRGFFTYWKDANNRYQLSDYGTIDFFVDVGGTDDTAQVSNTRDLDWHHYAVVKEGSTVKIYIDASVVVTEASWASAVNDISMAGGTMYFGTRTADGSDFSTYNAHSLFDEMRIYHKALSATELTTNYNNGKSAHS